MIQLKECEVYDFKELVIEELNNYYLLRIIDDCDGELAIRYEKDVQKNYVIDLIYMFLEMGNVCVVNNRLPIIRNMYKDNYVEVENLDNKKLKIQIYDPRFRNVSDLIINKYISDRERFFKSDKTKEVRLFNGYQQFMYKIDDGCLNITLSTDNRDNIINSEVEFITKYLYDKFSSIGEDVCVDFVNKEDNVVEVVVRCGDFRIIFPRNFTYSPILSAVSNYNNGKTRKRK